MTRSFCVLIVVLSTVIISSFALAGNSQYLPSFSNTPRVPETPTRMELNIQPKQTGVPEHIPYAFLLLRYGNERKQGKSQQFQKSLGFDQDGFRRFQVISDSCNREIEMIDDRAKEIVESIQKQFPIGSLPLGVAPPQIPQELTQLQEKRSQAVLKCRDKLRNDLGGRNSLNLETFVNSEITSKISNQK